MARHPHYSMSGGRWKIEQERFQLDRRQHPPEENPACRVGDLIPSLVRGFGLEDRLWEQTLLHDWPQLVGEQVARRTRPGRVNRKTLFVYVTNSVWLNELSRYGQQQILDNVQKQFGKERIQAIRLQLDPDAPR